MTLTFMQKMTANQFRMTPGRERFAFGQQSTDCLFNDEGELLDDGTGQTVHRRTRVALIRTGSITGLSDGATVTVNGDAYQVRGPLLPMEDGLTVRVVLARAS